MPRSALRSLLRSAWSALLAGSLLLGSANARAQERLPPPADELPLPPAHPPYFPVNAGLLYPLAVNVGRPELQTNFDLELIMGHVGFVDGLQVGPVGWVGFALRGVQLGAIGVVERRVWGAQIEGVFSYADGPVSGVQVTGLMGWATKTLSGVQLAAVANQTYGDLEGLQVAGVTSIARKDLSGVQLAGAVNVGRVQGFQLAPINVSQRAEGLQIGVLNVARRIDGLQIGVINITDDLQGESIGIAPIPRRGGVHPVLWGSSSVYGNAGVKFASRWAYSILSGALHSAPKPEAPDQREVAFGGAFTIGARFALGDGFGVASDVGAYRFFRDKVTFAGHDELFKLRLIASYELARRMSPFIGAGIYLSVRDDTIGKAQFTSGPELSVGVEL